MREAPHLIEHLLLSHTRYGETPVDAILALRAKGIKLAATTHSDFTEFTLEGPAAKAELMSQAMMVFLSRSSLPKQGFEREKRTILSELRADDSYVSSPSFYERYIAVKAGARQPCAADTNKFLNYDYAAVQNAYERLYTPDSVHLVAQAPVSVFDLDAIASTLPRRVTAPSATSQDGARETTESLEVRGSPGQFEFILPIKGRRELPSDAADALADQVRLEVQAHLRATYQLYTARSFVDQSLVGGWIRLEIPRVNQEKAPELLAIAKKAVNAVDLSQFNNDPVWQAYGSKLTSDPVGTPVVAELAPPNTGLFQRVTTAFWKIVASVWA
nr:insulinase family protein [Pseudomonas sp. MWU12-2323]